MHIYPCYFESIQSIHTIPISIPVVCCTSIHTIMYLSILLYIYPYYHVSIHTIVLYPYYCTSIHTIMYPSILSCIYPYYCTSIHTIAHLSMLSCRSILLHIYPYYHAILLYILFIHQTDTHIHTHTHTPFSTFLFEPSSSCRTLFQIYSTPGYVHPPLKVKCIIFPSSCTCIAQRRKP